MFLYSLLKPLIIKYNAIIIAIDLPLHQKILVLVSDIVEILADIKNIWTFNQKLCYDVIQA